MTVEILCENETEATAQAARYLDTVHPDWFLSVRVDKLDMQDSKMCVCGQAGLHWESAPEFHTVGTPTSEWFYPFASPEAIPFWEKEIAQRIEARNAE